MLSYLPKWAQWALFLAIVLFAITVAASLVFIIQK